jgi:S-layer protein
MAGATDNMSPQGRIDAQIVATKVSVATVFTDHIDTGYEIDAYRGDAAAARARVMLSEVTAETNVVDFTPTVDATIARLVQDAIPTTNTNLVVGVDTYAGTYANDTFNAVNAGTTLSASDSINGSDGYDTLNIYASVGVNDVQAGSVTSVETINIYNSATSTAEMYGKGTVDASMFVGATAVWQIGSKAQAIDGLSNETTAGFRGTTGQVLSVTADGTTASIALDGVGASSANVLSIDVYGSAVNKVVLAGSTVGSSTTVDLDVAGSTTNLTMIDALGLDGSLIISTGMMANGGTIKLGTGRDVVSVASNSVATGFESIGAMEKADAAAVGADATLSAKARAEADVLVFGSGAVVANANAAVTSGTIANGVLTFNGSAPSSVAAAIAIADAAAETAGEVVVFEYLGNSYVFQQAATDIVVRLTGTVGITNLVEGSTDTFFIV